MRRNTFLADFELSIVELAIVGSSQDSSFQTDNITLPCLLWAIHRKVRLPMGGVSTLSPENTPSVPNEVTGYGNTIR